MRKLRLLILLIFAVSLSNISQTLAQSGQELVDICNMVAGEVTYLKDFQGKLDAAKAGEESPIARHSVLLKKGIQYRFSICSSKDYSGEAILKVYDTNRLVGSTYVPATGKTYPSIDLKISKTGPYHIMVSIKDGEQGLYVAVLSFVKTL